MIFFILWTFFCGNLVINSLTNCNYSVLIFYQNSRTVSLTTCFFNKSYLQHCQCKMTLSFDPVVEIHHLAARDDWRFFLLRHTGCRRGHTPFTNVEAVKPDPLFLEGFSRRAGVDVGMKVRSLIVLSNHFVFYWLSAQSAAFLLLSDELMSCAAGADGCPDLRRRAFTLSGQWALRGADASWHGVLKTVWLLCDKAQQVGCLCRTQASNYNSQGITDAWPIR